LSLLFFCFLLPACFIHELVLRSYSSAKMLHVCGSSLIVLLAVIQVKFSLAVEIMVFPNCTGQSSPCVTMSSLVVPTDPNVALVLAPGEHQVSSDIQFRDKTYWEFKGNKSEVVCKRNLYTYSLDFSRNSKVNISGITFLFCRFQFFDSNNTGIFNTKFYNTTSGRSLYYSGGFNATFDRCIFSNSTSRSYFSSTFMEFRNVKDVHFTRSELSHISSSSSNIALLRIYNSSVFIGCSVLADNHYPTYSYLVFIASGSSLYVSNSTLTNNRAGSGIFTISGLNNVVIVSSVISKSWTVPYVRGGLVSISGSSASATILATRFVSNQGLVIKSRSSTLTSSVIIDCSELPSSAIPSEFVNHDAELCKQHVLGDISLNCKNSMCNCKSLIPRQL